MTTPMSPEPDERNTARDLARATAVAIGQLLSRGIEVPDDVEPHQLARLLESIEEFERVAATRGCDSFTNSLQSSSAEHPDCSLPRPYADESVEHYADRVKERTAALRSSL